MHAESMHALGKDGLWFFYVLCVGSNNSSMIKLKQCRLKTIKIAQQKVMALTGRAGPASVVEGFGGGIVHNLECLLATAI